MAEGSTPPEDDRIVLGADGLIRRPRVVSALEAPEPELPPEREKRGPWAPGPIFYALTANLGLAMVFENSARNRWATALLGAFGFIVAFVWLAQFAAAILRRRLRRKISLWAKWLGFPLVAALCVGLVASDLPFRLRWEMSRSAFDQALTRVEPDYHFPSGGRGATQIGWIDVDQIFGMPDGTGAAFSMSDSAGLMSTCWIFYGPQVRGDARFGHYTAYVRPTTDLGGGWWLGCG